MPNIKVIEFALIGLGIVVVIFVALLLVHRTRERKAKYKKRDPRYWDNLYLHSLEDVDDSIVEMYTEYKNPHNS